MAPTPLLIDCGRRYISAPCQRGTSYRYFVLVLTFLAYTSYHLSRKPISVVKHELHPDCNWTHVINCSTHNCTNHTSYSCDSYAPFGGSNAESLLGSLDVSFLFAYAIGMFLSGHVAERSNLRYFLTFGMITSGIFTALFGMAKVWDIHWLGYFIIVQILGGFVQSTGWPAVVACVANWFGKGRRGFIMGLWNSHTSFGNILGSVIAGAFVDSNWAWSFIVPGIIIAVMGIIVFLLLVPRPEDVSITSPAPRSVAVRQESIQDVVAQEEGSEEDPLVSSPDLGKLGGTSSEEPISLIGALRIPGVIEFALCLFFAKLVSYTFLFWLPFYIQHSTHFFKARDASSKSADLSTVFDCGGIAGAMLAGFVSDVSRKPAFTCSVMLTLAAPMLFIYNHFGSHNLTLSIVILFITGMLVNGPYGLITTAVSADLGSHESLQGNSRALSTVTAIIDGTGSVGAALGPLLTGLISNHGTWHNVFYMLIAADIAALLLLVRLTSRELCFSHRHRRL